MRRLWIAELLASPATQAKIDSRHGIHFGEVQDAIVCHAGLQFVWDQDEERGERAIVSVAIQARPALVVLYEADHPLGDVWHLGSAYFVD